MIWAGLQGNGKRGVAVIAASVLLAITFAMPSQAQKRVLPQDQNQIMLSYAPLVRMVKPAVVNIYTRTVVKTRFRSPFFDDPFFRRFFGEGFGRGGTRERIQNSLGSGVIVRADGLVVTNHHVVKGADQIIVALSDRREFEAKVILKDERTDLAVLRLQADRESFAFLEFMDSDDLEVGDLVLAIGNPFGVGQTVTSGIVSALARTQVGVSDYSFFIQTDAAINPGNSGGALVTMDGRLAGVNTAIFSKTGGSIGIGFAIPANMVRAIVESAAQGGRIVRPWLGASGQAVTRDLAAAHGLDRPGGVLINSIFKGGPADEAGLRIGDVVTEVDGRDIFDPQGLQFRVVTKPVGGVVTLTILRKSKQRSVRISLVRAPEEPPRNLTKLPNKHILAGATIGNLSPALAEELGLGNLIRGVIVLELAGGSRASRLRLRPGDILLKINDIEINNVSDAVNVIDEKKEEWRIAIRRGEQVLNVVVR